MYTNEQYENSAAYKCVIAATIEQLRIRRPYTLGAIDYHERHRNTAQVRFFKDELALIDSKIK